MTNFDQILVSLSDKYHKDLSESEQMKQNLQEQLKVSRIQQDQLELKISQSLELIELLKSLHETESKRALSHIEKLAKKITKQDEFIKLKNLKVDDYESDLLRQKDCSINRLTKENSNLFLKIGTMRSEKEQAVLLLSQKIKSLEDYIFKSRIVANDAEYAGSKHSDIPSGNGLKKEKNDKIIISTDNEVYSIKCANSSISKPIDVNINISKAKESIPVSPSKTNRNLILSQSLDVWNHQDMAQTCSLDDISVKWDDEQQDKISESPQKLEPIELKNQGNESSAKFSHIKGSIERYSNPKRSLLNDLSRNLTKRNKYDETPNSYQRPISKSEEKLTRKQKFKRQSLGSEPNIIAEKLNPNIIYQTEESIIKSDPSFFNRKSKDTEAMINSDPSMINLATLETTKTNSAIISTTKSNLSIEAEPLNKVNPPMINLKSLEGTHSILNRNSQEIRPSSETNPFVINRDLLETSKKSPSNIKRTLGSEQPSRASATKVKHIQVVRDKNTRKQMHGHDCYCCKDYYRLTKNLKPLYELGQRKDSRKEMNSRHRVWDKKPDTPPGFWDVGFPDTQTILEYQKNGQ